jgi:hypothetical protein
MAQAQDTFIQATSSQQFGFRAVRSPYGFGALPADSNHTPLSPCDAVGLSLQLAWNDCLFAPYSVASHLRRSRIPGRFTGDCVLLQ